MGGDDFRFRNKIGRGYPRPLRRTGVFGVGGGGPGDFLPARSTRSAPIGGRIGLEAGDLAELGADLGENGRFQRFQGVSIGRQGGVARRASHGLGYVLDRASDSGARRLIANLTEGRRELDLVGAGGGWVARPRSGRRGRLGAIARGGLPPFGRSATAPGVAFGGPSIRENRDRSSASRRPIAGVLACSRLRSGGELWSGSNGSGFGRFFQPRRMGSGVRTARARQRVGGLEGLAAGGAAIGSGHERRVPFGERIWRGYACRAGAVNG